MRQVSLQNLSVTISVLYNTDALKEDNINTKASGELDMTTIFTSSAVIDRNINDVWEALTDWDNAPSWMSGVDSMSALGETEEGTKILFHARGSERPSEITKCVEPDLIVLCSKQGSVTANYAYKLAAQGDKQTLLTLEADCHIGSLGMKLLSPILKFAMKKVDGGQPMKFKQYVEGK